MVIRSVEILGLVTFLGLLAVSYVQLFSSSPLQACAFTCLAVPCAYYAADLLTGIIHWVCDSFGSEKTPLWGPMLVGPFRRHHRDPMEITRISLVENLGASALAGSVCLALLRPEAGSQGFFWHFWLWFLVFAFLSNLFHRWSHRPESQKPVWMLWLQRAHVLLPSEEHWLHHKAPHRVNYCILSGWANPLTNRVPWARLEAILLRCGIPTNFD